MFTALFNLILPATYFTFCLSWILSEKNKNKQILWFRICEDNWPAAEMLFVIKANTDYTLSYRAENVYYQNQYYQ